MTFSLSSPAGYVRRHQAERALAGNGREVVTEARAALMMTAGRGTARRVWFLQCGSRRTGGRSAEAGGVDASSESGFWVRRGGWNIILKERTAGTASHWYKENKIHQDVPVTALLYDTVNAVYTKMYFLWKLWTCTDEAVVYVRRWTVPEHSS